MGFTSRVIAGAAVAVVVVTSAWVAVANEANKRAETTPTTGSRSSVGSSSSTSSSTSAAASTTMPDTELSRAWVESREHDTLVVGLSFDAAGIAEANLAADYTLSNPNVWTTPMGALCWADFEITRTAEMAIYRELVDHDLIPLVVEELGVEDQVPSDPGPATTGAVTAILESYTTTTTTASTDATTPAWGSPPASSSLCCDFWIVGVVLVLSTWTHWTGWPARRGLRRCGPAMGCRLMCCPMRTA